MVDVLTRFWRQVDKNGPIHPVYGQCWQWRPRWAKKLPEHGYGRMVVNWRIWPAHRLSYELNVAHVPEELSVLHRCDNRGCVNPDHLFLGTHKDNTEDMVAKGRQAKGDKIHTVKLTESQVLEIRRTYIKGSRRYGLKGLARKYGVTFLNIHAIVSRRSWKHV